MHIYKLQFSGTGFVIPVPPVGQLIDGFSCTLFLKSSSESEAREAGLAALRADPAVSGMIQSTQENGFDTFKIECEAVTKLGPWRHLLPLPKRTFDYHWSQK